MPPKKNTLGTAQDWLKRAKGSLARAKQDKPKEAFWADLCFDAQEAVEKSIKAVLEEGFSKRSSRAARGNFMKESYSQVYQFKIILQEIEPQIWRRIEVPETYTFWDLHVAIQDAMGWLDCYLHEFEIPNPDTGGLQRIGIPDKEWDDDEEVLKDWDTGIADYLAIDNPLALYTYDFGEEVHQAGSSTRVSRGPGGEKRRVNDEY